MKKTNSKRGNARPGTTRGDVARRNPNGKRAPSPGPSSPPEPDSFGIVDYRLEKPLFEIVEVSKNGEVGYEVRGDLNLPVPPIRESKYLAPKQVIEIYRWMLLNRRMEAALENLYKQGKVVGGVYFGLGQEACSCASAYALGQEDWLAPMIRNQGSLLVKGFSARDIMMQYMAKAGSPTKGRDASSHFGDIRERNVAAPISMLGDLIGVMAGVALGARYQGKNIACMTYIGDGGQSTGIFHESLNFAAVQKLGLVLIVENNLWGYSTPVEHQFAIKDLAQRALAYGIPGVVVDGTDTCQVYDVAHEACERARRGDGPTLIEAKMMRMKGHAIHDAAQYVPRPLFEFWQKRDPIARLESYLLQKKWLTREQNRELIEGVEAELEADREFAVASPMPEAQTAAGGVFCDGTCHAITPKYGLKTSETQRSVPKQSEAALHFK
ncbi:MAG: thiamine pyrophosphate-dependent dehydrogenase E1 component subunit alpha [Acidobacteria bacterium]|nr:thiamine pyrophosphate-dependent dehydrogenase E1 component subunit alpha [Acidobacteriota bacterium]